MNDLVERAKQCADDTEDWTADVMLHECVARIEKLEAALREIADWPDDYTMNRAAATARAALEERT